MRSMVQIDENVEHISKHVSTNILLFYRDILELVGFNIPWSKKFVQICRDYIIATHYKFRMLSTCSEILHICTLCMKIFAYFHFCRMLWLTVLQSTAYRPWLLALHNTRAAKYAWRNTVSMWVIYGKCLSWFQASHRVPPKYIGLEDWYPKWPGLLRKSMWQSVSLHQDVLIYYLCWPC